jgi:hypothetical protein
MPDPVLILNASEIALSYRRDDEIVLGVAVDRAIYVAQNRCRTGTV